MRVEREPQIRGLLERCGLLAHLTEIERAAVPAIGIRSVRSTAEFAPTASHFGGIPLLAAATGWPIWTGRRLPFLGQINLADVGGLPRTPDLPVDGLLQFFYQVVADDEITFGNKHDAGAWRVLYVHAAEFGALESAGTAQGAPDQYPESALAFHPELTYPDACPFESSLEENYGTFVNEVSKHYAGDNSAWGVQPYGSHRLLGHWLGVQLGDVLVQAHATSAQLDWWSGAPVAPFDAHEWCLLLQLDTDGAAGLDWAGSSGMVYFCIPRRDLAARRFDRVWLVLKAT